MLRVLLEDTPMGLPVLPFPAVETGLRSHPEYPRAVLVKGHDLVAAETVRIVPMVLIPRERSIEAIHTIQPASGGADPENAARVFFERHHTVAPEARRSLRVVGVAKKRARFSVESVQATTMGRDPEYARRILEDGRLAPLPETRLVSRVVLITFESSGGRHETIQSAGEGPNPQDPALVHQQAPHAIVAEARGVGGIVQEVLERPAGPMETIEPAGQSANPEVVSVLGEGRDDVAIERLGVRGWLEMGEEASDRVPEVQTARFGADPEHPASVLKQDRHGASAQAPGVHRIIGVANEGLRLGEVLV